MPDPQGSLTAAQYEILAAVWDADGSLSVAEIWQRIAASRSITRTTVLNQVGRLEKRGWLVRRQEGSAFRYAAAIGRGEASSRLAGEFVSDFFGGSAAGLVSSLLGTRKISADEIDQLRKLLQQTAVERSRKGGRP